MLYAFNEKGQAAKQNFHAVITGEELVICVPCEAMKTGALQQGSAASFAAAS